MDTMQDTSLSLNEGKAILFVDDEFGIDGKWELSEAVKKLQEHRYEVKTVTTMAEAVDCFMSRFYHVFVLDLDMHKTLDTDDFQPEAVKNNQDQNPAKRGGDLAKVYKSLDNGCAIVIYSAAGTVEDLYKLANCHVFGYVAKGPGGDDDIVAKVEEAAKNFDAGLRIPNARSSGRIIIGQTVGAPIAPLEWESIKSGLGGNYEFDYVPLEQVADVMANGDYAAVVVADTRFSPQDLPYLKRICDYQPRPHVILAAECRKEYFMNLLDVVNLRPMRLVNLLVADNKQAMVNALRDALKWFDGWETFEASLEYVRKAAADIDWEALAEDRETLLLEDLDFPFEDEADTSGLD